MKQQFEIEWVSQEFNDIVEIFESSYTFVKAIHAQIKFFFENASRSRNLGNKLTVYLSSS